MLKIEEWLRRTLAKLRRRIGPVGGSGPSVVFSNRGYQVQGLNPHLSEGCNLIGYARAEFGLGEHLRLVARALEHVGLPFLVKEAGSTVHRRKDQRVRGYLEERLRFNTNLFCCNSNLVAQLSSEDREIFSGRFNIGYGYWELTDYPLEWLGAMNWLQEIWAPSCFVRDVIAEKSSIPVLHMPVPVECSPVRSASREEFGLPRRSFLFLFIFDFTAVHRKNPEGVVRAFKRAFPVESDVRVSLVLKGKTSRPEDQAGMDRLLAEIDGDPRIRLLNEYFSKQEVLSLISVCDAYISLHRAEGFGLPIAEAMGMGKPAIATDYSGNRDFMTTENSCLVPFDLIRVRPGEYFGLEGKSLWAEPDLDKAVGFMRKLVADPDYGRELGRRASATIREVHNFASVGRRYRQRLELLGLLF